MLSKSTLYFTQYSVQCTHKNISIPKYQMCVFAYNGPEITKTYLIDI